MMLLGEREITRIPFAFDFEMSFVTRISKLPIGLLNLLEEFSLITEPFKGVCNKLVDLCN